MIKVQAIFHFNFDKDDIKVDYKGQKLLNHVREMIEESIVEEDFSEKCKLVGIKLIEEEVEPF